jgi:hypothetical protein
MVTVEIPREGWRDALDEFTIVHDRWLVSLDVLGSDIGAQPEIEHMPLLGVSADRIDHDGTITISLARSRSAHFTHVIHDPTRVLVERTDVGADAALRIDAVDGTTTILRFRSAPLPETVDGLVRR